MRYKDFFLAMTRGSSETLLALALSALAAAGQPPACPGSVKTDDSSVSCNTYCEGTDFAAGQMMDGSTCRCRTIHPEPSTCAAGAVDKATIGNEKICYYDSCSVEVPKDAGAISPTKTTTTTTTSATSMSKEATEWLQAHNMYRCMHGVPLLKWSQAVAEPAQAWANHGVFAHGQGPNSSFNIPPPGGPAGENLAEGGGIGTVGNAVMFWYNEVKNCKWPGCQHSTNGKVVGHFTAMIWKGAKEVGCGVNYARAKQLGPLYVCHYKGDGIGSLRDLNADCTTPNMIGCYDQNVPQAVKSEGDCGGHDVPTAAPGGKCTLPHSLPANCTRCRDNQQCETAGGGFCCPHLKMCITDKSSFPGCFPPVANCVPNCFTQDCTTCHPTDGSVYGNDWAPPTCQASVAADELLEPPRLPQHLHETPPTKHVSTLLSFVTLAGFMAIASVVAAVKKAVKSSDTGSYRAMPEEAHQGKVAPTQEEQA